MERPIPLDAHCPGRAHLPAARHPGSFRATAQWHGTSFDRSFPDRRLSASLRLELAAALAVLSLTLDDPGPGLVVDAVVGSARIEELPSIQLCEPFVRVLAAAVPAAGDGPQASGRLARAARERLDHAWLLASHRDGPSAVAGALDVVRRTIVRAAAERMGCTIGAVDVATRRLAHRAKAHSPRGD
jgi:hypothetical protein